MWADPGSARTSGLGKRGSDTVVPGRPDCSGPLAVSLVPLGEALGAATGPPSTVPSRVRTCVRVARPLPGSHPAGAAFATAARVHPTSRRRGPFRPHASSQLDSWTRPAHSCLSSEKGGTHLVGRVQLLLVNRFFKVSE